MGGLASPLASHGRMREEETSNRSEAWSLLLCGGAVCYTPTPLDIWVILFYRIC